MSELTTGTKIGRAITKLHKLMAQENEELAQSPAAIRSKYSARVKELLDGLEDDVRQAVLAVQAGEK